MTTKKDEAFGALCAAITNVETTAHRLRELWNEGGTRLTKVDLDKLDLGVKDLAAKSQKIKAVGDLFRGIALSEGNMIKDEDNQRKN